MGHQSAQKVPSRVAVALAACGFYSERIKLLRAHYQQDSAFDFPCSQPVQLNTVAHGLLPHDTASAVVCPRVAQRHWGAALFACCPLPWLGLKPKNISHSPEQ